MLEKLKKWLGNEELALALHKEFEGLKDRVAQLESVAQGEFQAAFKPVTDGFQAMEARITALEQHAGEAKPSTHTESTPASTTAETSDEVPPPS